MIRPSRLVLYAVTVSHLRPAQILHRVRLRGQRAVAARLPERVWPCRPGTAHGWPAGFAPLDAAMAGDCPSAEANAAGAFRFLGEERFVGTPPDWGQEEASQLWRYHLHYFEWAWAFAAHPDRVWARAAFACLWRSWRAGTHVGRGDAWSPYVASLRAWALCGVFDAVVRGSDIERDVADHLARHGSFLRAHVEHDVGGNHLVKNLKALLGLGVFLGDPHLVRLGREGLARQLPVQVLPDGGHYERSPSYHCQVLSDALDVGGLLGAAGAEPVAGLDAATDGMRRWLGAVLLPDGDVPLFNDCSLVGAARLEALGPQVPEDSVTVLEPSGYVVVRTPRLHLVADVGPPCPPDLPAHAHADCLSFELAVDGARVVVDTGASTYAPGWRRAFERSTAAHNTVEVDGCDQSQVWGVFRAARLARTRLEGVVADGDHVAITASHDGYRRLPGKPVHRRTWRISDDSLRIDDDITGAGAHELVARLHLAPGVAIAEHGDGSVDVAGMRVSVEGATVTADVAEVAVGFGPRLPGVVLSASAGGELPLALRTTMSFEVTGASPSASTGTVGVEGGA